MEVAPALGVQLYRMVRSLDDFDSAFAQSKRNGPQALITGIGGSSIARKFKCGTCGKEPVAAISLTSHFVAAGGPMICAPSDTA